MLALGSFAGLFRAKMVARYLTEDGWFRLRISGAEGYVSEAYVLWDAIDTF